MSAERQLVADAAQLGVCLDGTDAARLLRLVDELERWNRTFNLTAIRDRADMLTHHILDSLSIQGELHGATVADVGTGAGFPGLPLALLNPQRHFTLIDSNGKKVRFVNHAVGALGLANVKAVHGRVEALHTPPFDTVVARAFAPLGALIAQVEPLCSADTRVLAMKGRWPQEEIAALPRGWHEQGSRELHVPRLAAARCVIVLQRAAAANQHDGCA